MTAAVVYGADSGATASSTTITRSTTTLAGEGVGIWVKWGSQTVNVNSVSDGTNTYTAVSGTLTRNTDNGHSVQQFYCPNLSAGTRTVTVTFSASVANRCVAYARFQGVDTNAAQAGAGNFQITPGPGTTTDGITSGNATPTSQPGVAWAVAISHIGAHVINPGTGYTGLGTIATYDSLQGDSSRNEWKRYTSTSAFAGTFTQSGSGNDEYETTVILVGEATAGGDVTSALTGVSGTGAAGTAKAAVSYAVSGNAATGAAGSVSAAVSQALTGNSAAGAAGTLSPAIDKGLTGNSGTGAVGSAVSSISYALTGNEATAAAGTVGANVSYALTGVQATGAAGTVSTGSDVTASLTGVSATGSAGSVAPDISVALTGVSGTGSTGTLASGISYALTGVSATGAAGSVISDISVALTGVEATGQAGTVSVAGDVTRSLTGVEATGYAGNVSVASNAGGYGKPKRRFIQRVGDKIVVFNNASDAIRSLSTEAPVPQETKEPTKPPEVQKPDLVVSIPEVKQLATPKELPKVTQWIKRAEYEALLMWFERKREEEDEEALLLML